MLSVYQYETLTRQELNQLCIRNSDPDQTIREQTLEIIEQVRTRGDEALRQYNRDFDDYSGEALIAQGDALWNQSEKISREEMRALEIAFNNIHRFHQRQAIREKKVETAPGVTCWREMRPIERVGLYIPGGTAVLPSTFLMLGVPARIAGCKEIVICTPPQPSGEINPYLAYCARLLQIDRIYLTGGAQAIAAMAYGTGSIPKVDKIFGPGNPYVTMAKQLVQSSTLTAIDMPAGPSEVLVIADETSDPEFVAADLLAQAEHGADSRAILVSTHAGLIEKVQATLPRQLSQLGRKKYALKALEASFALKCTDMGQAFDFSNRYAPEHLIVALDDAESMTRSIQNAGSVFLGRLCPESMGDYASGTNHTLPTSGYARAYSGVSLDSFVKKLTFQQISREGLQYLGPTVEILADIESLQAHKHAVSIRLNSLDQDGKI